MQHPVVVHLCCGPRPPGIQQEVFQLMHEPGADCGPAPGSHLAHKVITMIKDRSRSLDLTLVLLMLACTPGRGPWLAHPVAAPRAAALSDGHATFQRESSPRTVTNATELADGLRTGGVIRLAPGRYAGNFVVAVDGTTVVGRTDLPDARVRPDAVAGVVLAPAT